jgi:hypothetical protein
MAKGTLIYFAPTLGGSQQTHTTWDFTAFTTGIQDYTIPRWQPRFGRTGEAVTTT